MSTADLPVPDYDHLALGDLTTRVRSLDVGQLDALVAHEEDHGARAPVLTVLRHRRAQLDAGAETSSGDAAATDLQSPAPASGGSRVGTATQGEEVDPAPHGVPGNPH